MAMVDFFYRGEAKVFEENLNSFLSFATELQLKGLEGNQKKENADETDPIKTVREKTSNSFEKD